MESESFIYIGVLFFLLGAVSFLLPIHKGKNYFYIISSLGSLSFAAFGFYITFKLPLTILTFPISSLFEFVIRADALSGFFVILISILALSVSVYSIGYTEKMERQGFMGFIFNFFILSMYAVVLAGNIITFLIAWETMSIISYFLVTFDRSEKSAKAGLVYGIMTHIGTAFIIVLFFLLYSYTGTMSFYEIKAAVSNLPEEIKTVVFLFSIIGFGTKAGIIPLHTWLPKAHPAAPSNISSLMSGAMIKTGIYGFLRISMDVMGSNTEWWGIVVIIVGAISSVLGVMYALMEHDIKKLLAYHSVENIGIILLGIGASIIFKSHGMYNLSALALIAALYHTLNHAIFKGLLFLAAGSVIHSTGTKNLEDMGGLIKRMPYTALFFLIGSVSICALPPFNGFVSEWLTYQSLLLGFKLPSFASKLITQLGGAALALTGALAAACFVKAFGILFLGMPRSAHAEEAKESSFAEITGMGMLAILCLLLGIFPNIVISVLSPVSFMFTGSYGVSSSLGIISIGETLSTLSPAAFLITMFVMFLALFVFIFAVSRKKSVYRNSWDCGIPALTSRMQYTATAFTKPIRTIFKKIYLPKREVKISYTSEPLFVKSIKYSAEITPLFDRYIYEPITAFINKLAEKVQFLQSGSLHLYLGYILATLIFLLIFSS